MNHPNRIQSSTVRRCAGVCATIAVVLVCGLTCIRYAARTPRGEAEYVALGSSFAAGPGDGQRATGSYFPCMRSSENYAHLFAQLAGLKLEDVTCSGATTDHVLEGGQFLQPAQLDAVRENTKLVTVTVGGNDVFYLGKLGAWACANDPEHVPRGARWIGLCKGSSEARVEQAFARLPAQMAAIVEQVHRRAPSARLIFVDYTTVLPDRGTCGRLHLSEAEADEGRQLAARLAAITAETAWKTNSGLVQASEITRGHDVCSADPWVYGFQFPQHLLSFGAAPFHPRAAAMQRIAEELVRQYPSPSLGQHAVAAWDGNAFVRRAGDHLTLAGQPYRYGGMNIEWLGLEGYGPKAKREPYMPSDFEVEDAMATAEEMGSRVVRSQTLGDTIGCPQCLEPAPGVFNEAMFRHIDGVLASAARHHIRLIIPLTGDCAACAMGTFPVNTGMNQYLNWFHDKDQSQFYTDSRIGAALQAHIRVLLEHRNSLTGFAYKDDPTILAWENCNLCSVESHIGQNGKFKATVDESTRHAAVAWVNMVGAYIKSIDGNHLYIDNSGFYRGAAEVLNAPSVDGVSYEYYRHWFPLTHLWVNTALLRSDADLITSHGKVDMPGEIGWDRTDWYTQHQLRDATASIENNTKIAGDNFWALQAHAIDHGWQAVPADDRTWTGMLVGESGEWWALYYTGRETRINGKQDMAARAQLLRSHFYAMAHVPLPAHAVPPQPRITSLNGQSLSWRGSAGAERYTVERSAAAAGPWEMLRNHSGDDDECRWTSNKLVSGFWYRVTAVNADGRVSEASPPERLTP